jgi:hypothetical protein
VRERDGLESHQRSVGDKCLWTTRTINEDINEEMGNRTTPAVASTVRNEPEKQIIKKKQYDPNAYSKPLDRRSGL